MATPGEINRTGGLDSIDPIENPYGSDVLQLLKDAGFSLINEEIDFFSVSQFPIDNSLFYQILPYRLLILQASPDSNNQTKYTIISSYTLPIGPQNLSIDMSFANLATALADGMLIEENGAPFRDISIKGSTGFLPFRDTQSNNYGAVFGNTVKAATQLANVANPTAKENPVYENSGYSMFQRLYQFLESYAVASRNNSNFNLRLALDLQKENATYLVIPKTFSLARDADSPLEYHYSITFQAWKRIQINTLSGSSGPLYSSSPWLDPTSLGNILADVQKAAAVVNKAIKVAEAAVSDVESFVDQIRQVTLAIKNISNIPATLVDMPNAIVQGLAASVASSAANLQAVIKNLSPLSSGTPKILQNLNQIFLNAVNQFGLQNNLQSPTVTVSGSVASGSNTTNGSNPSGTIKAKTSAHINNPATLSNPYANPTTQLSSLLGDRSGSYEILGAINLQSLKNIPANVQSQIDNEYALVKSFTRKDFQKIRDKTNDVSRILATYFGQDTSVYNSYYGINPTKVGFPNKKLTRDQMNLLSAVRTLASSLDSLSSQNTYNTNKSQIDLSFNYVGQLIQGSGIPFSASPSKYAVPVPYGMTLNQIANLYLGNPSKSVEIAVLNNLLPPYIQEDPFVQYLLVNASNQSIVVSDGSNLLSDQKIILSSNVINPFAVKIKNVKKITNTEWLITINSSISLDSLKTSDLAKMQYYLPGTVNSSDIIYIPSSTVLINNLPERLKPITFLPDVNNLNNFSYIDFLLDNDGDLVVNNQGDLGLAGGLVNILQALKLKFLTVKGSNFFHNTYGAGVAPGTPSAKINIEQLKADFTQAISADRRFREVVSLKITINNGTLTVNGTVALSQVNKLLPFGWVVNNN